MKRLFRSIPTPILVVAGLTAAPFPGFAQPAPDHAGIVFSGTPQRELALDLYLPKSGVAFPLVIYIHGGGWRGGNPKKVPFSYLTGEGFAVASISYRFSQEAKFPAQLEDVRAALRWLRENGATLRRGWLADGPHWRIGGRTSCHAGRIDRR